MLKEIVRGLPVGMQKVMFSPIWGGYALKASGQIRREKEKFRQYDAMSLKKLEEAQLKALQDIVSYAYKHVPFYRKNWDAANFNPEQLKSLDDMNRIPIIDKSTIINHVDELISDEVKKADLIEHKTGGSTGIPALLYYDVKTNKNNVEMVHRWRNNAGVLSPCDKCVLLFRTSESIINDEGRWGFNGENYFGTYDMFSNSLCFSTMNLIDKVKSEYVKRMVTLKPKYMQGYASAINNLAVYMRSKGQKLKMKAVLTSSDMLTEDMRENIETVFQCKVFDRYGQGEEVASAIECDCHKGYHIDMDRCYIQVVNNQGEAVFEKKGTIVGTSLMNYAMPLIRYNMHDEAALTKAECSCGRTSWRLYDLSGRSNDILRFESGRIADSTTLSSVFSHSSLEFREIILKKLVEYQFEQFSLVDINMNIVLNEGAVLTRDEREQLENILIDTIGENVKVKLCEFAVLDRGASGKLRFIINRMNE